MTDTTPADFRSEVQANLARARESLASFLSLAPATPFEELVGAYDEIRRPIDAVQGWARLYAAGHPDADVREAAETAEQEISALLTELGLHRGVYDRLEAAQPAGGDGPEVGLRENGLEVRLREHALRDFRRAGVDRDEATRERVRALQEALVTIGQRFDKAIVEGRRSIRVEGGHAALGGLPDDWLSAHPEDEDGSVTITTDGPDVIPFMAYAEDGELRRRMSFEFLNRAYPDNLDVLGELLGTRHELAGLLGYSTWAEYVTEDKMVGSPQAAREFLERVAELARIRAGNEYDQLLTAKRERDPAADSVLEYELRFLEERIKREQFGFDSQSVRPYFSYERVRDGLLDVSARLYGVTFRRADDAAWHPAVETFDVIDGGECIARFYLDMFPREGKYKHAAMFGLDHGTRECGGAERVPRAAILCNFPEPRDDGPALLLHGQVKTFFHEFGHLLHELFAGGQRYFEFAGIATEWDFVEVPSQMFEEWVWDADVLRGFARHHETDEPIPTDLVERMRAAAEYGKGLHVATQMFYALYSLTLYEQDPADLDTTALMEALRERLMPIEFQAGTHFQAAFGHLHGYSAIYYTYMWSLVIAKDVFGAFDGRFFDTETATRYRREVLAPGGARDAADLVRSFLGREYEFGPWEAWLAR